MKNRKKSGIDGIPIKLWKFGGKEIYIRLVQLLNEIWTQGNIPLEWNTSIVIRIYKKGEKKKIAQTTEENHF